MSFPRYEKYKDSGVEWLGEVPAHWDTRKFRYCFRESSDKITHDPVGVMLSVSGYRGVEIKRYEDDNQRRLDEDLVGYRIVRPEQLVVNTMWLNYAGLGVSRFEGHVSPAYRAYWIQPGLHSRFIHHLLRCYPYVQGYTKHLTGVRPNSLQMSRDDLMNLPVLLPSTAEQEQIADFLDRETAKIDALIHEQGRFINRLREKRQSAITHAVTQGLTLNVPMKHSGLRWIPRVPAHWVISAVTRHVSIVDYRGRTPAKTTEGVFLVTAKNVRDGRIDYDISQEYISEAERQQLMSRGEPHIGEVLFTTEAPMGQTAQVDRTDIALAQRIVKFRAKPDVENRFLMYWIMGEACQANLKMLATGSTAEGIKGSKLGQVAFCVPPMAEQREIVGYLDRVRSELGTIEKSCESAITLLQERRAALISAAVTGKIDVRNYTPRETPVRDELYQTA